MRVFFVVFFILFSLSKAEIIPLSPFSFNKKTVLLFHFDRGPKAKSGFPSGPEGKVKGAQWKVEGKFRSCLFFDGKDDCVETILNEKNLSERVIKMWINPEKKEDLGIIYHEVESPGCNSLLLLQPDGRIKYQRVYCGVEKDSVVSKLKVNFGEWNYLVFKLNAKKNRIEFIINGIKGGPYNILVSDSVSRIAIGGKVEGEQVPFFSFYGYIDEVCIEKK